MKSTTTTLRTLLIIMCIISLLMVLLFFISANYAVLGGSFGEANVMTYIFFCMAFGIGPIAALTVLLFSRLRTRELETQGISQKKWKIANATLIGACAMLTIVLGIIDRDWKGEEIIWVLMALPFTYSVAGILVVTNIFRALCPNALDRFWAWKWGKPLMYSLIAIAVIAFAALAIWDIQERIEVANKLPHKSAIEMFK